MQFNKSNPPGVYPSLILIFLSILADDVLPILLVALVGLILARFVHIDGRTLSQVILYTFLPCLVFYSLITSQLRLEDFGRMALFALLSISTVGLIAWLIAFSLHLEHHLRIAFLFVVMFSNVGNFGLSLVTFAFGQQALTYATVYFITSNVLLYTIGTALISSRRQRFGQAVLGIFRLPVVYAVLAAAIVMGTGLTFPQAIIKPLELLSRGSIPSMLLVLGVQLNKAEFKLSLRRGSLNLEALLLGLVTLLRLVVAPVCSYYLAVLCGLNGPAFQAGLVESGTPVAVVTSIFAVEFEVAPEFITNAIFLSTVLSPLTLTALIFLLK